jgi:hypothetical protein
MGRLGEGEIGRWMKKGLRDLGIALVHLEKQLK